MRIWSILLIKSNFKWIIHLGRSIYVSYINHGARCYINLLILRYLPTTRMHQHFNLQLFLMSTSTLQNYKYFHANKRNFLMHSTFCISRNWMLFKQCESLHSNFHVKRTMHFRSSILFKCDCFITEHLRLIYIYSKSRKKWQKFRNQ